ncbi:protein rep, partial [Staphylococcus capitis]|uniref:protein rep n=1 Tax=Staphylococcus capitis TaxID=29388 RepID=UPI0028CB3104
MMEYIKEKEDKELMFLRVRRGNVRVEDLEDEIKHYNESFRRLTNPKHFKSIPKPYLTKLQITYNKKPHHYNPHFHLFIPLNKSYFTHKPYYITHKQSLQLSPHLTPNQPITQLHLQNLNQNNNKQLYQIPKYSPKHTHYLLNQKLFHPFYNPLKPKQLLLYSPFFKHPRK